MDALRIVKVIQPFEEYTNIFVDYSSCFPMYYYVGIKQYFHDLSKSRLFYSIYKALTIVHLRGMSVDSYCRQVKLIAEIDCRSSIYLVLCRNHVHFVHMLYLLKNIFLASIYLFLAQNLMRKRHIMKLIYA